MATMDMETRTATTYQRKRSSLLLLARSTIGSVAGLCLATVPAAAAEWGGAIGTGVAYTDNLERAANGNSVTVALTEVSGQILDVGHNHDLDVEAAVVWHEYLDSAYETDVLPQLRGEVNWAPIPERFVWTVRDNFGQVALTPAESLQPFDRQDINVFSTGPAMTMPLGRRLNLQLAGLYSDVYYEDDEFDLNRLTGSVTIERQIARSQFAYVRGFSNRTDFKDEQFGGYDIQGYFLGYDGLGTRTEISAEVGIEELHDGGEVKDGLHLDVAIHRRLSERVGASLRYISRYVDAADIFALSQDLEPRLGGTSNVQISSDPISNDFAMADVKWEGLRTSTGLMATWSSEDADSTVLPDREIYGIAARASRWLTDSTRLGATVSYSREEWSGPVEQRLDDVAVSLDFQVQLSAKVSLSGYLESYKRSNSPANYDENRVVILLRYTPKAVSRDLPSFYERRLTRRFAAGGEVEQGRDSASDSRQRP